MLWLESVIGTALWCWWQVPARRYQRRVGALRAGLALKRLGSSRKAVISGFPWVVNQRHHRRSGDRQRRERASRSWCAYSRPSLPLWMLGWGAKMLGCPVRKQFAVLLSKRSKYRSRASHQKARSKALTRWRCAKGARQLSGLIIPIGTTQGRPRHDPGRSCANSGHYKPLCACVDRTKFVAPASVAAPTFFY